MNKVHTLSLTAVKFTDTTSGREYMLSYDKVAKAFHLLMRLPDSAKFEPCKSFGDGRHDISARVLYQLVNGFAAKGTEYQFFQTLFDLLTLNQ